MERPSAWYEVGRDSNQTRQRDALESARRSSSTIVCTPHGRVGCRTAICGRDFSSPTAGIGGVSAAGRRPNSSRSTRGGGGSERGRGGRRGVRAVKRVDGQDPPAVGRRRRAAGRVRAGPERAWGAYPWAIAADLAVAAGTADALARLEAAETALLRLDECVRKEQRRHVVGNHRGCAAECGDDPDRQPAQQRNEHDQARLRPVDAQLASSRRTGSARRCTPCTSSARSVRSAARRARSEHRHGDDDRNDDQQRCERTLLRDGSPNHDELGCRSWW